MLRIDSIRVYDKYLPMWFLYNGGIDAQGVELKCVDMVTNDSVVIVDSIRRYDFLAQQVNDIGKRIYVMDMYDAEFFKCLKFKGVCHELPRKSVCYTKRGEIRDVSKDGIMIQLGHESSCTVYRLVGMICGGLDNPGVFTIDGKLYLKVARFKDEADYYCYDITDVSYFNMLMSKMTMLRPYARG